MTDVAEKGGLKIEPDFRGHPALYIQAPRSHDGQVKEFVVHLWFSPKLKKKSDLWIEKGFVGTTSVTIGLNSIDAQDQTFTRVGKANRGTFAVQWR